MLEDFYRERGFQEFGALFAEGARDCQVLDGQQREVLSAEQRFFERVGEGVLRGDGGGDEGAGVGREEPA